MLGTFSLDFFVLGGELRELSLFIDESGSNNLRDRYYLLTLVLHEQDEDVSKSIHLYERSLAEKGLSDIPFHASPLLNGHDEYENMDPVDRRRLLSSFRVFFCHMPVRYTCITLKMEGVRRTRRSHCRDAQAAYQLPIRQADVLPGFRCCQDLLRRRAEVGCGGDL